MHQTFLKWWKNEENTKHKKYKKQKSVIKKKSNKIICVPSPQPGPVRPLAPTEDLLVGSTLVDAFGLLLVDCCCCRGRRLETRWHRDAELVEPVSAGRTRCRSRPESVEGQVAHVGALFAVEPV